MTRVRVCLLLVPILLATSACGSTDGGGSSATPPPAFAAPVTTAPPAEASPPTSFVAQSATLGSVVVAENDEVYLDTASGQLIHRDSAGIYVCVILRTDDLAALRARAVQSSDNEEADEVVEQVEVP